MMNSNLHEPWAKLQKPKKVWVFTVCFVSLQSFWSIPVGPLNFVAGRTEVDGDVAWWWLAGGCFERGRAKIVDCGRPGSVDAREWRGKKQKVWTGRSRRVGIWAGRHVGSMSAGGHEWARTDGEWKRASTHGERRRAELATAHPWPQIFIVGGKGVRKEVPPTNHETSSWFYPHWLGVWFRFDCWRFHFWVLLAPVLHMFCLSFRFQVWLWFGFWAGEKR